MWGPLVIVHTFRLLLGFLFITACYFFPQLPSPTVGNWTLESPGPLKALDPLPAELDSVVKMNHAQT